MKLKSFLLGLSCLSVFFSCTEHELDPIMGDREVNEWIKSTMDDNYLWYDEIPGSPNYSLDPEAFFYSLLFTGNSFDKGDGIDLNGYHYYFSTIEQAATTKATSGSVSYGFDFATYSVQSQDYIFALVLYVLPGSPAEEAGLKRGDWITSVNSATGYIYDRDVLESGGDATFYIGEYGVRSGQTVIVSAGTLDIEAARAVEDTPFIENKVIQKGNKKIGYLCYNHFTTGPNGVSDNTYDTQMRQIFANFKAQGVNEFVLDLRYNGGGYVSSAQLLTSLLAPATALSDTFCILEYSLNTGKTETYPMLKEASNLNLSQVYVLTSQMTASASEAVINGLIPYMGADNVVLIGEQTLGKTVGSVPFKKSGVDWVLHPIVLRIFNKKGEAKYEYGFEADYELYELNFGQELYPLGDESELLLNKAIELITGTRSSAGMKASPATTPDETRTLTPVIRQRTKGLIAEPFL